MFPDLRRTSCLKIERFWVGCRPLGLAAVGSTAVALGIRKFWALCTAAEEPLSAASALQSRLSIRWI